MRRAAPRDRPAVVCVGRSDPTGAGGVEGALKAAEAAGAHGASVVTAVGGEPVSDVPGRLREALDRFDESGVWVGELPEPAGASLVTDVAAALADHPGPVVVDGPREGLFEPATLVAAGAAEAESATDVSVGGEAGARLAGQRFLMRGADAALVSTAGDPRLDVLVTEATVETARHEAVEAGEGGDAGGVSSVDGAGVALSAGVAAGLAAGEPAVEAVADAVAQVERGVRYPSRGVQHLAELRDRAAARETVGAVEDVVAWFVDRDLAPLVPEVGTNVVGATPYAESPADCAAVDGRLVRTESGVREGRGVRFGASTHAAAFLLAARERAPGLRFAVNCRLDAETEAALSALSGPVVELDGPATDEAVVEDAFAGEPPAAALDRGGNGREPMILVVGTDARTVAERVVAVLEAYRSSSAE